MAEALFVYAGDADFHDGSILAVEHRGSTARVRIHGASGKVFVVDFGGVQALQANQAEGMVLYALSELEGQPPVRRFAFANWDDNSPAYLEVDAETVAVREE